MRLTLRKPLERHLRSGHPWLYRDAFSAIPPLPSGSIVEVADAKGRFLARGAYDAESPIAVRVFTLDEAEPVDEALFARRLSSALAARRGVIDRERTTAFRLVNGEGDRLPGVVIDLYHDVAVLRLDGAAARAMLHVLVAAMRSAYAELSLRSVYLRERGGAGALLFGPMPEEEILVTEHGVRFAVNVRAGQKTGSFLDQRDNRLLVRGLSRGLSVWNGFSYTGGFSVQAALGGATRVVSVDLAEQALHAARRNFTLNGLDPARHEFLAQDVFHNLRQCLAMGLRHDLVIVDPPSFAPSERALQRALLAYRDLFAQAMAICAPGGLLCASSCSSHVDLPAFIRVLGEAAQKARRDARVLAITSQGADHPTLPAFPEGRYLKFVVLRLD